MQPDKKLLLIVPERIISLADEAADALQISRLAFIRQAIIARLISFRDTEKRAIQTLLENEMTLSADLLNKENTSGANT